MSTEGVSTEEEHLLIRRAMFGEMVQEFMSSDIGKYLLIRAEDEVQKGMLKLKTCDPENSGLIREYQGKIEIAESIPKWLDEAVTDGLTALRIIEDRE